MSSPQAPAAVIMVRPHSFNPNPETAADNVFQASAANGEAELAKLAATEFNQAVSKLENAGVGVHVFDQPADTDIPDCVFPNNWLSTHTGGHIAVFPMFAKSRQRERRWDIIEMLKKEYRVQDVVDYSGLEYDGLSLEGTGAMVLDNIGRIAYTARSNRADPVILERFCTNFNYEPMVFDTTDETGAPIYHTNVMMTIATDFALFGGETICDERRRQEIINRLEETGRQIVFLSHHQIREFAGNALELDGANGPVLAISARGLKSLTSEQKKIMERRVELLPISIPSIETAGGSVRCMLAAVHLSKR